MSAILGRVEYNKRPIDARNFDAAMTALAHYGGDTQGCTIVGHAGFGFHGLEVARCDGPDQNPVRDEAILIVADAILDDRIGLARALNINPAEQKTLSDSALILRAYRKWGEACTEHLVGDFTFAIFDTRSGRLMLARDHIGARPLYWAKRGASLVFATDIRGLLAFSDIDWRIDETMVARYLRNTMRPMPKCFFGGMYFLPPGHRLVVDAGEPRLEKWWHPENAADVRHRSREGYIDQFRSLTEEAVACRVQTNTPVGSHISGGLDSAAVTLLAQRSMKQTDQSLVAAYAWAPDISEAFPDMGPGDERHKIQWLCDAAGVACRFGSTTNELAALNIRRRIELDGTTDLIDELPVMDKAATDNVRVMLSGWGGDEAFSVHGFGYLASMLRSGRLIDGFKVNRYYAGGLRNPLAFAKSAWSSGVVPMLPDALYQHFAPYPEYHSRSCFADNAFLQAQQDPDAFWPDDIRHCADPMVYMRGILERGHLGARMATWAAWSAKKKIQYRYPLTDKRLVEFVLGVPPDILFYRGRNRYLAKAAFSDLLPRSLGKSDPANESLRARAGKASLMNAAVIAGAGGLDTQCSWVNQDALKARLSEIARAQGKHDVFDAVEVFGAILILKMRERIKQDF